MPSFKKVKRNQEFKNQFERRMERNSKNGVAFFIQQLWDIVEAQSQDTQSIKWNQTGLTFCILNQEQFSEKILSKYFKHSNFSSFIRQLNMYNFKKIRNSSYQFQWIHQLFRKNHKQLLIGIKRKATSTDIEFGRELLKIHGVNLVDHCDQKSISTNSPSVKIEQTIQKTNQKDIQQICQQNHLLKIQYVELWNQYCKSIQKSNESFQKTKLLFQGFFMNQLPITSYNFNLQNFLNHLTGDQTPFQSSKEYLKFSLSSMLVPQMTWSVPVIPFSNFASIAKTSF